MKHETEVIVLWIWNANQLLHVGQLFGKPFNVLGNVFKAIDYSDFFV